MTPRGWRRGLERLDQGTRAAFRPLPFLAMVIIGALVAYHGLLVPAGGRFYDGDLATPFTSFELRAYLSAYSGPWNPQSITGGLNPFFTNAEVLLGGVAIASALTGSTGDGVLTVMLAVQVGLAVSMYWAARRYGAGNRAAAVAALSFAASPLVFDRTVAGHELILAAAVLLPPFLALLAESVSRATGARHAVAVGLLWGGIGLLEYHVFYLSGIAWAIALGAGVIVTGWRSRGAKATGRLRLLARTIGTLLVTMLIAVGINLVWVVPSVLLAGGSPQLSYSGVATRWVLGYSQSAIGPYTVLSANDYGAQWYTGAWPGSGFPDIGLALSALLSAMFLFILLTSLWRPTVRGLLLTAEAGIFLLLSTGTTLLGGGYLWLVDHVPLFAVNDDPSKFDVVALPCLALILGASLSRWWSGSPSPESPGRPGPALDPRSHGRIVQRSIAVGVAAFLLLTAVPYASGEFAGDVAHVPVSASEAANAAALDSLVPPDGRVAYFPPDPYQRVGQGQPPTNPLVVYPPGSDAFLPGPPGLTPENLATRTLAFAYVSTYDNLTSHAGSLFGVAGVNTWDVSLGAARSPAEGLFSWAVPQRLNQSLAAQVDLGAPVAFGQFETYQPTGVSAPIASLRGAPVLALADQELLLDAAYLPNGDRWVADTPFVLAPGGSSIPLGPANGSVPFVETPEGAVNALFAALPAGQVVPLEPVAWQALAAKGVPTPGDYWTPWENQLGLESGRPLASNGGWVATEGTGASLSVSLPSAPSQDEALWADVFYGPLEGVTTFDLGGGLTYHVNASAPVPMGFQWTWLGPTDRAGHVVVSLTRGHVSTLESVAVASPGDLSAAQGHVLGWLQTHGGGATNPPILWIKGDEGTPSGRWVIRPTGSLNAQGWASEVRSGGTFSATVFGAVPAEMGVLLRAAGFGTIGADVCATESLFDPTPRTCASVQLSVDSASPTWVASPDNLTLTAGPDDVTLWGASGNVTIDQAVLAPDASALLGPCPSVNLGDWLCSGLSETATSVAGDLGGPSVTVGFTGDAPGSNLVHLVSCDANWRADGPGVSSTPFVVDGWACAYAVSGVPSRVQLSVANAASAEFLGRAGSVGIGVPAVAFLLLTWGPVRRRLRVRYVR